MGIVKWLCSRFNCNSTCSFNNELFDAELHNLTLSKFELKHKDMLVIHKILKKRKKIQKKVNENNYYVTEI